MPIIDFTEIPRANIAGGEQDTFELFARDFFEMLGFLIDVGPDRGQDGGRDLIISEQREGIIGTTTIKWLVSCKHKAHSGQAVLDGDELDIRDRVRVHGASGFIGCYSTLISSPLGRKLEGLKQELPYMIFDKERIETQLLESEKGLKLIKRYFPVSFEKWENHDKKPANLLNEYEPLTCVHCGKDLLSDRSGIIVFVYDPKVSDKDRYVDIYWSCKGVCDRSTEHLYKEQGYVTAWEDISDIVIPGQYLRWIMAHLNRLREKVDDYDDEVFSKLKDFIIMVSQVVLRNQT
jgi:hypothetical protein